MTDTQTGMGYLGGELVGGGRGELVLLAVLACQEVGDRVEVEPAGRA